MMICVGIIIKMERDRWVVREIVVNNFIAYRLSQQQSHTQYDLLLLIHMLAYAHGNSKKYRLQRHLFDEELTWTLRVSRHPGNQYA
jgi:hypothetical protein